VKWLGHYVPFQGTGYRVIKKGEIAGIAGEGKMLERAQQGEQEQPGQQENAEKAIFPEKENWAIQQIPNGASPAYKTET
jgi:hypothetical protein